MKKTLLFLAFIGQFVYAQHVDVLSIKAIESTNNGGYYHPVFSPTNQYLLATDISYSGLKLISFTNNEIKNITYDSGAGYGVRISKDGNTILHKKNVLVNNLKFSSLIEHSIKDNAVKQLVPPTREQLTPAFSTNQPYFIKGTKLNQKSIAPAQITPLIQTEDRKLVLYNGNSRKVLTPNGVNESYFWSSISPDNQKIAYTVAGKGTFVSNIDGTNVKSIGKLNAPKWLNNKWLVGMDDKDDGNDIISSVIVVASSDGKIRQTLTKSSDMIAMYPAASVDAKQIAFCTEKGQLYLININVK